MTRNKNKAICDHNLCNLLIFLFPFHLFPCFVPQDTWNINLCQWFSNCLYGATFSRLFQTVKFPFPYCQNILFQTVKISFSKPSKFSLGNCQNFSFLNCQNFLSKLSKFPFETILRRTGWSVAKFLILVERVAAQKVWETLLYVCHIFSVPHPVIRTLFFFLSWFLAKCSHVPIV